jgi:hypothetical protein
MPHTFSLGRLMLIITLLCVFCAVAVYYGRDFGDYLLCVLLLVPTAIVCVTLASFSEHRKTTLAISVLGAVISDFIFNGGLYTRHCRTVWEVVQMNLVSFTVCSSLGALVLGGALLLDEKFSHRDADQK